MTIVFHSNQLGERGTETAIIDYAEANKKYLNNESVFAFPEKNVFDKNRFDYLSKQYKVILWKDIEDFERQLKECKADLLYAIVDGKDKDICDEIKSVPTFTHCVFSTLRPHGTYYCAIHKYLNDYFGTKTPVLPHIVRKRVDCKEDLREELGIPQDARVFASYGGKTSFDIQMAHDAVIKVARENPKIYFLFMNIENFVKKETGSDLPNVIFLPGSTDFERKAKFINTSDAMIHARVIGETFGLSCGEFSIQGKPVITYAPTFYERLKVLAKKILGRNKGLGYSCAHLMNLGKKAIKYNSQKKLEDIFTHFERHSNANIDYDCFSEAFSSERVIKIFEKIIEKR